MAIKSTLSNFSYSNYENGYSEPPAEIIVKFRDVLNITMENLLELKVAAPKTATVRTFADLLSILIDLDKEGFPLKEILPIPNKITNSWLIYRWILKMPK